MNKLSPGLLIAMPQLADPNFHRSIVFMLEHNDEGAMGLIVNKPSGLTLGELGRSQNLAVAVALEASPVFMGGPVATHRGFVLHDFEGVEEKTPIVPGLYVSVSQKSLEPLLVQDGGWFRFALGYAGWGPGQLEKELTEGSWLFQEVTVATLKRETPEDLWEKTLLDMGIFPASLVPGGGVH